uniref:Mediator of RNA polymerase II transcription subunit 13 n=1 Tax=Parastrongyloides trichosuri TaxID=131310 RepID=A0A0N4Z9N3_PARTI
MTTKNHKDIFDDYSNLYHKDSIANDVTLEDCHTNVFPLADITKLKWKCYSTSNRSITKNKEAIKADLVLKAYSLCISENYICLWRRIPSEFPENDYPRGEFTLRTAKELWVFWFDKREPRNLASYTCDLVVREEYCGDYQNEGVNYDIRCLLFRALHNLMERSLFTMGQKRFGKWFVATGSKEELKQSMPQRNYSLAYGFSFFVHGDNMICATINIQRQPLMCKIGLLDYFSKKTIPLILGPHGIRATLVLDQIECVKEETIQITNKHKRNILVAKQYKEVETIAEEQYNDWRGFYPLPVYDAEDVKYRVPSVTEILPRMTLVEIDNLKMLWPTECIGIIMDEDESNGDRKCFYEKIVDEDQEVATIMSNNKENPDVKIEAINNPVIEDVERVNTETYCRHRIEDIDKNSRIFEDIIVPSEYAVLKENIIDKPMLNMPLSSTENNDTKDKFESAISFLMDIDNDNKKDESKPMEIDDDDDIESFLKFDNSVKPPLSKSPEKNTNENKSDKMDTNEKKNDNDSKQKDKVDRNEETKDSTMNVPKYVEPAIGRKWRFSNYCSKTNCVCHLCRKFQKIFPSHSNKIPSKNDSKGSALRDELMTIDEEKENEPIQGNKSDVKQMKRDDIKSYDALVEQRKLAKTVIPIHPNRSKLITQQQNIRNHKSYKTPNYKLRDHVKDFQTMDFGNPKLFSDYRLLSGYNKTQGITSKESFPKFAPCAKTKFEYHRKKKYILSKISHKKCKKKVYHLSNPMAKVFSTPAVTKRNRLINETRQRYTFPKEDTLMARDVTFYDRSVQKETNGMLNSFISCLQDIKYNRKNEYKFKLYSDYEIIRIKSNKKFKNCFDDEERLKLYDFSNEEKKMEHYEIVNDHILRNLGKMYLTDDSNTTDLKYLDPFMWNTEEINNFNVSSLIKDNEPRIYNIPEYIVMSNFLYIVEDRRISRSLRRKDSKFHQRRMFPLRFDDGFSWDNSIICDEPIGTILRDSKERFMENYYSEYLFKPKEEAMLRNEDINKVNCTFDIENSEIPLDVENYFDNLGKKNVMEVNILDDDDLDSFNMDEFLKDATSSNSIDEAIVEEPENDLPDIFNGTDEFDVNDICFKIDPGLIVEKDSLNEIETLFNDSKRKFEQDKLLSHQIYECLGISKSNNSSNNGFKVNEELDTMFEEIKNNPLSHVQVNTEVLFENLEDIFFKNESKASFVDDLGGYNNFFTNINYSKIVPSNLRPKKQYIDDIWKKPKPTWCNQFKQVLDYEIGVYNLPESLIKKNCQNVSFIEILRKILQELDNHRNVVDDISIKISESKIKPFWKNLILNQNVETVYFPMRKFYNDRHKNAILIQEDPFAMVGIEEHLNFHQLLSVIDTYKRKKVYKLTECFEVLREDQISSKNILKRRYDRMLRAFDFSNRFLLARHFDDSDYKHHMMYDYEFSNQSYGMHGIPQHHGYGYDYYNYSQNYNNPIDEFGDSFNSYGMQNQQHNQSYYNDPMHYPGRHNNQMYHNYNTNMHQNAHNHMPYYDNFINDDFDSQIMGHNNMNSWNQGNHMPYGHSRNSYLSNYHQSQSNMYVGNPQSFSRKMPMIMENDEEKACAIRDNETIMKTRYFKSLNDTNMYYKSLSDNYIGCYALLKYNFKQTIYSETNNVTKQNQYHTFNYNKRLELTYLNDSQRITNDISTFKERNLFSKKFESQICIRKKASHISEDELACFNALQHLVNTQSLHSIFIEPHYYNRNLTKYKIKHQISEPMNLFGNSVMQINDNIFGMAGFITHDEMERRKFEFSKRASKNPYNFEPELEQMPPYKIRRECEPDKEESNIKLFPCRVGYSDYTMDSVICGTGNDEDGEWANQLFDSLICGTEEAVPNNDMEIDYGLPNSNSSLENFVDQFNSFAQDIDKYAGVTSNTNKIYNNIYDENENEELLRARFKDCSIDENYSESLVPMPMEELFKQFAGSPEPVVINNTGLSKKESPKTSPKEEKEIDYFSIMTELAYRVKNKAETVDIKEAILTTKVNPSIVDISLYDDDDEEETSVTKYEVPFAQNQFNCRTLYNSYDPSYPIYDESEDMCYTVDDYGNICEGDSNDNNCDLSYDSLDSENSFGSILGEKKEAQIIAEAEDAVYEELFAESSSDEKELDEDCEKINYEEVLPHEHFKSEYCEKYFRKHIFPVVLCRELLNNWTGMNLITKAMLPRYSKINDIYALCMAADSQEMYDNLRDSVIKKIRKLKKNKIAKFAPDYYKIIEKIKDYGYTLPYETYILYREGPALSYAHYLLHNDVDNFIHLPDCECIECAQLPPIPTYIDLDDSTSKNPYIYNYKNPPFIKKGEKLYDISSTARRYVPPMMPHHTESMQRKCALETINSLRHRYKYANIIRSINERNEKTIKNGRYYKCGALAYKNNEMTNRSNATVVIEVDKKIKINVVKGPLPPPYLRRNQCGAPVTRNAYERLVPKSVYLKMRKKRLAPLNFKQPKPVFFKGYDMKCSDRVPLYNEIVSASNPPPPEALVEEIEEEDEYDECYDLNSLSYNEDCPVLENNSDAVNMSLESNCGPGINSHNPLTPNTNPLTPSMNPLTPSNNPLTPSMNPNTPSMNPLTPGNGIGEQSQIINPLTPNANSLASSGPPSNYMNPGSNSYPNPGSNNYPNPGSNSYPNPGSNSYSNPGSNSYSNPASNTYPNPGSNNSVLQSIISQPSSQGNPHNFIGGNISSPSSFHGGNQMNSSMMPSPIISNENQFIGNSGNYNYNRQMNPGSYNPMRDSYNSGMYQNRNNPNVFQGNEKHNIPYPMDGGNNMYEQNQYHSNMSQMSNTDSMSSIHSEMNSNMSQSMNSHYNSPMQQNYNSPNTIPDRNSQHYGMDTMNHGMVGNMNQGYMNSNNHHMMSGNQKGSYNNPMVESQFYNKMPTMNYDNNSQGYINNRNQYSDENNPNEASYDSSYNNMSGHQQMNSNEVFHTKTNSYEQSPGNNYPGNNPYPMNYNQNNYMDSENGNGQMCNNDDFNNCNMDTNSYDMQQNCKDSHASSENSPMPLLYNEAINPTEPSIIDSNTEYNCLYYEMEVDSVPPASSLPPVETEKLTIESHYILPIKPSVKVEEPKKDVISRRDIKKDSIGISLLLQDSVFELYYDIIFDGCPICSCNSNIMSDDYGMYLRPPSNRNSTRLNKPEWNGFYLAGQKSKCQCGFSALRHKLFSYNSGLFKEDAEEGSGLVAVYDQHSNKYHTFYNEPTETDFSFINLLRIQSLNREMGAQISVLQNMLTKCIVPKTNAISNKYLNKCSNYMFSQVDINEKEHAIYNSFKASIEDDGESHLCLPNRNRKLIDYPSFLHPWSIQFPNNAKEASDPDCYIVLDNVSKFFKNIIHNTQCFGSEKRKSYKTLTWSELVRNAYKNTKGPDECPFAPEPIPSVIVASERDVISCAPQIVCSWEKLALGPIDQPKDILYFAITPDNDFIVDKTKLYLYEVSKMYETYKLGRHIKLSKDIVEDGIFRVPVMDSNHYKIETDSEKGYYEIFDCIINDKEYVEKMKSYALFIEKQVYQFFEYNDILFDRRAYWECVKQELSGFPSGSHDTSLGGQHGSHEYVPGNYPPGYYDHSSPPNFNRSGNEMDQQRSDSPIKDEDMADMPHIVVLYVINPFNFGTGVKQAEQPKFALISLMRAFNSFLMKLDSTKRIRIQLEIINLQSILDYAGYISDKKRNERWYAPDSIFTRNKNFKFSAYEQIRSLSFAVYTHSRIYNAEDLRYVLSKSVTKFGYSSTVIDQITEGVKAGEKIFKLPCNLYRLSLPKRNPIQVNGKILKRHVEDTVLFVSYCLIEDKWLAVTVSDHLGYLLDNCLINLQVNQKENELVRYKKGHRILDAISRLWMYVMGVLASETRNWRVVIGRFGRVGHTEFKAWMHILSKTNIKRYNSKIKEACNLCAETFTSQNCPVIVSACFVSMEAENNLRLFHNAVSKEKVMASAAMNTRPTKQKVIHSPDDVSVTHILVFPTTVDLSADLGQGKEDQKDDFDSLELEDGNEDILNLITDELINDSNEKENNSTELENELEGNFFNIDPSDIYASNQPMAIGYYISTAPTGKLPNWFWSQCPKAKDRCPVHLRNSLHIVTSNILQSDEQMLNFKNTDSTHPLDSTATDDVLRYVLKTYNALSWLNVDCVTSERRSCLPIHIQALARLCDAVETFMF